MHTKGDVMKKVWLATLFTASLFLMGCGGSVTLTPEDPGVSTSGSEAPPHMEVNPDLEGRIPGYAKPPRHEILPPRGVIEPPRHEIRPGGHGTLLPPRHVKDPLPTHRSVIKPHPIGEAAGTINGHKK